MLHSGTAERLRSCGGTKRTDQCSTVGKGEQALRLLPFNRVHSSRASMPEPEARDRGTRHCSPIGAGCRAEDGSLRHAAALMMPSLPFSAPQTVSLPLLCSFLLVLRKFQGTSWSSERMDQRSTCTPAAGMESDPNAEKAAAGGSQHEQYDLKTPAAADDAADLESATVEAPKEVLRLEDGDNPQTWSRAKKVPRKGTLR